MDVVRGRDVYGNKGIGECNGHRECDDCTVNENRAEQNACVVKWIFKVRVIYVEILGNLSNALIVLSTTCIN